MPQYITVYHSISQYITVYHSISQYITVYHSISQYTTVYHSISQYTTVYHCIPQYITVYHTVYHSISQYTTVYHTVYLPFDGVVITDVHPTVGAEHLESFPGGHLLHESTWAQQRVLHTHHPPTLENTSSVN